MSLSARLLKLEARLLRPRAFALPPSMVRPIGASGEVLEPQTIELFTGWPLVPVREWHREEGEEADAFIDRVLGEAPPNAMLRQVTP